MYLFGLVQDHRVWGYIILFIAMVLEGETFLIIAGMLASLVFDVGDVLWISLGVVLGNTMWYYIGTKLKDSGFAKRIIKWSEKAITFFCPVSRETI